MNLERERELFLAWLKETNKTLYEFSNDFTDDDSKESLCFQWAWSAWLASASRDGYKLVPVDTLEECLNWASIAMWDSPSKERDIEITHHVGVIEAMLGAVDET